MKNISTIGFLVSLVAVFSCGQPKVEAKKGDRLLLPMPESALKGKSLKLDDSLLSTFSEGDTTGEKSFAGSLVIWKDAANFNSANFVNLLKATNEYNSVEANRQKAFTGFLEKFYTPKVTEIESKEAERARLKQNSRAEIDTEQIGLAKNWISTEFSAALAAAKTQLGTAFTPEQDAQLEQHFSRTLETYCEAKIWEFATSKVLAAGVFTSRPSPNALCESVYERLATTRGLFQHPTCDSNQVGQTYFACFWIAGVPKTSFYAALPKETQEKLPSVMAGESARQQFAGNIGGTVPGSISPNPECGAETILRNLLKMSADLKCRELLDAAGLQSQEKLSLVMVSRDAANLEKAVPLPMRNVSLATITPERIITEVQAFLLRVAPPNGGRPVKVIDILRVVPASLTSATDGGVWKVPDEVVMRVGAVTQKIAAWMRPEPCEALLTTPNDIFFNLQRAKSVENFSYCKLSEISGLPNITAVANPKIDFLAAEIEQAKIEINAKKTPFCLPQEGCSGNATSAKGNWTCKLVAATGVKKQAVEAPGVAQAVFTEFILTFKKQGAFYRVSLAFGASKRKVAEACLSENGAQATFASCEIPEELAAANLTANVNLAEGTVRLLLPVSSKNFLLDLPAESVKNAKGIAKFDGKVIDIELYPNKFGDVRSYLSGKAIVRDSAKPFDENNEVAQGVASYLFDQNLSRRINKVCSERQN